MSTDPPQQDPQPFPGQDGQGWGLRLPLGGCSPQHQSAPVPLAIFGSQAQKYAGDINNSFFAVGAEHGALAPAGLGRGAAQTPQTQLGPEPPETPETQESPL